MVVDAVTCFSSPLLVRSTTAPPMAPSRTSTRSARFHFFPDTTAAFGHIVIARRRYWARTARQPSRYSNPTNSAVPTGIAEDPKLGGRTAIHGPFGSTSFHLGPTGLVFVVVVVAVVVVVTGFVTTG